MALLTVSKELTLAESGNFVLTSSVFQELSGNCGFAFHFISWLGDIFNYTRLCNFYNQLQFLILKIFGSTSVQILEGCFNSTPRGFYKLNFKVLHDVTYATYPL